MTEKVTRTELHPAMNAIAGSILQRSDGKHVVVGPAAWQPSDGTVNKRWYLNVATSGAERAAPSTG
jgi:hypothetical protein